ncbi:MAG TPA: hypothetical protein VFL36_10470 [Myxococcales bacterium]|nr:hypothetical protein [Myxococcales bacterium]
MPPAARRLVLVALVATALCAWAWRSRRRPEPLRPAQCAPERRQAVAKVGPVELTASDLSRYSKYRRLSLGIAAPAEILQELTERTLLLLAAESEGLVVGEAEFRQELLRRQLLIAAGLPPGRPWRPGSPFDRAARALARSGFTPADLEAEVRADALARIVTQRHAPETGALLAALRTKWKVEISDRGGPR